MTEEGTLSIVRQGPRYQVRYASNNLHDRERLPYACPDEAHLAALLHHFGTESTVISQVCADVRQGKMAVLLVVVAAEQLQAFFPLTHQAHSWARSACHASVSSPVAAVLRQDAQRSSSRQPRSHALWVHAREARGAAEKPGKSSRCCWKKLRCCWKKRHWRWESPNSSWKSATSDSAGWELPASRGGR